MTDRVLISSERGYSNGIVKARVTVEVLGPGSGAPQWAVDRAISHVDSVIDAVAPGLRHVVDLVGLSNTCPKLEFST